MFVASGSLDGCPLLTAERRRLAAIPVVERSIEGKHAMANTRVHKATKPSPPLFNLALRSAGSLVVRVGLFNHTGMKALIDRQEMCAVVM
eukprot:13479153-Alexandrium_andersonii.AAC.1